ncbi:hypothetical protein D3C84_621930 [compost metagenome]
MRFGHAEAGAGFTGHHGHQPARLLLRCRDLLEHVHVAFVRRGAVECHRAKHRIAGGFEDYGLVLVGQAQPAQVLACLGRQQAGFACLLHQLAAQARLGTVGATTRVLLKRNDDIADKGPGFFAQGELVRRQGKVHGVLS